MYFPPEVMFQSRVIIIGGSPVATGCIVAMINNREFRTGVLEFLLSDFALRILELKRRFSLLPVQVNSSLPYLLTLRKKYPTLFPSLV